MSDYKKLGGELYKNGLARIELKGHKLDEEGLAKAKKATSMMAKHFVLSLRYAEDCKTHLTNYAHSVDLLRSVESLERANAWSVFLNGMADMITDHLRVSEVRCEDFTCEKIAAEAAELKAQQEREAVEAAKAEDESEE